jgi:hypothetical protein
LALDEVVAAEFVIWLSTLQNMVGDYKDRMRDGDDGLVVSVTSFDPRVLRCKIGAVLKCDSINGLSLETFPGYFANFYQARDFCWRFFDWYNVQHRHSGIALLTPEDVHLGPVVERRKARQSVLLRAWQAHPERFVRGTPRPPELEPITRTSAVPRKAKPRSHPWSRTY